MKLFAGENAVDVAFDYAKSRFRVPYGAYVLVVEELGFREYRRPIRVLQPETDILVGLELAAIATYNGPRSLPRIAGRLVAENLNFSSLWVRALPIFRPDGVSFDSRVDSKGRFSIVLYDPTDSSSTQYMLLVLRPKQGTTVLNVAATREVAVPNYETTNVEIAVE
ncbi:MAG: hypothetical protein H6509_14200 [Bryobacterales bacterium]|nr:hypothetical protein [Acidobacteriota bacterium]MCB9385764.1 hypothetical protein [Bryobacterales bacterium]